MYQKGIFLGAKKKRYSPKCLREYSFIEQDTVRRFKRTQIFLLAAAAALLFFGG